MRILKKIFLLYNLKGWFILYSKEYRESEDIMVAVSKQKLDTNDKYLQQLEDIKIRVPKGYRDIIKKFAKDMGYDGVNPFVLSLINEKMQEVDYFERIPSGIKEIKKKESDSE